MAYSITHDLQHSPNLQSLGPRMMMATLHPYVDTLVLTVRKHFIFTQAAQVLAKDDDGTSDPYVELYYGAYKRISEALPPPPKPLFDSHRC